MATGSHIFLSYNSRDRPKVEKVQRYLSEIGVATFFDQLNLRAGQNWPQALERALTEASAVAVFVGPKIGDWQWPEIGFALDRQANDRQFPVIPVLLDGANTSRSFLFLNTWLDLRGNRLDDRGVLEQLRAATIGWSLASSEIPEINPYCGLKLFDEEQAPFFFGREAFSDALFERLTQQRKRFVAVIGASGSGKSSLVRAGLIPKLRRRRPPAETWDVALFKPGERPWFSLASTLAPLRFPDIVNTDLDVEIDKTAKALQCKKLRIDSICDHILRPQGQRHRLLVVIDQFEELFTISPAKDRVRFIEELVGALSVNGVVLMPTLRADFYGQAIESDRRLSEILSQEQVTLGRLTTEELRRAIIEPARLARLEFDPGLPEILLQDAGNEPGNLPLLQHALLELYEQREGRRLTLNAYRQIGGIRGAITQSAEREYRRLDAQGLASAVRGLFTQLVRLARAGEGSEDTRRRISIMALPKEAKAIVDELASDQLRLLVKSSERIGSLPSDESIAAPIADEQQTVEVAHEALIREWGRLRIWLNENRAFYLWRQRLDQALSEYAEHQCDDEYLLRRASCKNTDCGDFWLRRRGGAA